MTLQLKIAVLLVLSVFIASCGGDSGSSDAQFDRTSMLKSTAENIILPNAAEAAAKANALNSELKSFVAAPTGEGLTKVQNAWKSAFLAYINITPFNFGPGENGLVGDLLSNVATFPANTGAIEERIVKKNVNFNDFARDTRGFLALDYLLFDLKNDNSRILESFKSSPERGAYVAALAQHLASNLEDFNTKWASYQKEFVANNGTSAGSSISLLYNEFVRSYEAVKNFKVALPLGKRPGQLTAAPQLVEAYYSGISSEAVKAHVAIIEKIWKGVSKDSEKAIGFEAYLLTVEGGKALTEQTKLQQETLARTIAAELPTSERLSLLIETKPASVEKVLTELQKGIRFYKSDMSSLLGISITYTSGDGD